MYNFTHIRKVLVRVKGLIVPLYLALNWADIKAASFC